MAAAGYLHHATSTSPPSTPHTPATPLPLLLTSRRTPFTSVTTQAPVCPLRKPSMLANCFSVDSCMQLGTCSTNAEFPNACAIQPQLPSVSLTRKVGAEFFGTFILVFVAAGAAITDERTGGSLTIIGKSASAGLAVMVVILSIGHISGAHLNPAVTLAFAALCHFPWIQVPAYLVAQSGGSICASFVLKGVFNPDHHGGVTIPNITNVQCFFIELITTFTLMFVITAVATDTRAVGELAGLAIGGTVMMNIIVAGASTSASMNPARTLGPAIAANNYHGIWLYMVAPTLGALIGASVYTLVRLEDEAGLGPKRWRSRRVTS